MTMSGSLWSAERGRKEAPEHSRDKRPGCPRERETERSSLMAFHFFLPLTQQPPSLSSLLGAVPVTSDVGKQDRRESSLVECALQSGENHETES